MGKPNQGLDDNRLLSKDLTAQDQAGSPGASSPRNDQNVPITSPTQSASTYMSKMSFPRVLQPSNSNHNKQPLVFNPWDPASIGNDSRKRLPKSPPNAKSGGPRRKKRRTGASDESAEAGHPAPTGPREPRQPARLTVPGPEERVLEPENVPPRDERLDIRHLLN